MNTKDYSGFLFIFQCFSRKPGVFLFIEKSKEFSIIPKVFFDDVKKYDGRTDGVWLRILFFNKVFNIGVVYVRTR
jgi:hypothetical protein